MPTLASTLRAGMAAAALTLLGGALPAAAQPAADTLATIRARGALICGTSPATAGFANPDSQGVMRGLDADYCRAVAAAILGDGSKARITPTSTQQRFTALQSGEIDMLSRVTTWTLSREASLGLAFAGINVFDGQGFLVHAAGGVTSARQLDGATVCLQPGSTTELNLADYFRTHGMRFTPVLIEDIEELRRTFLAGRCDAFTTDATSLAALRVNQGDNASRYVLLPELISKEPLGIAVRKGDWRFFDVVRWTHFALLTAEEMGLTQESVTQAGSSTNPDVQRFLGRTGDLGKMLGLENDWAVQVVRAVGNYGEVWNRNLAPLGIPRGVNELWTKGGLHYAPPMR
ncbi:amino acid ABC transporter substrate-binding protein [Roseomonas sp. BN140053]|uniref:amino acid ABC transporter substrate-binding protein n=1 Tax=Roseomonas sp. BN140053 TaxID=3391898 RepID=UPI0039ED9435